MLDMLKKKFQRETASNLSLFFYPLTKCRHLLLRTPMIQSIVPVFTKSRSKRNLLFFLKKKVLSCGKVNQDLLRKLIYRFGTPTVSDSIYFLSPGAIPGACV